MSQRRPLFLFATLALAFAPLIVGCGGSGDSTQSAAGGSGASTGQNTANRPAAEEQKGGEASIEEFGSEAEGWDREEVLSVFSGYLGAIADKDYAGACSHLSAGARESLEELAGKGSEAGCSEILPALLAPSAPRVARQQADGEVTRVRVQDDRAFVVFRAPGAKLYQLTMIREDGRWRAATVAAAVLVPEL